MRQGFSESAVEGAALAWLESLGRAVRHGREIAPGELSPERANFGLAVLARRLRDVLARLNPQLPSKAFDDTFKLIRPEGPTLEVRNLAMHQGAFST